MSRGPAYGLLAAALALCAPTRAAAPDGPVTALLFLPEHRLLAAGYGQLRELDGRSGRILKRHPAPLRRIADLSLAGPRILACGGDPGDAGGYFPLSLPDLHAGPVTGIAKDVVSSIDEAGGAIAAASPTGEILIQPGPGRPGARLKGHTRPPSDVTWFEGGAMLASASLDSTVRIWSRTPPALVHVFTAHSGPVRCIASRPAVAGEPLLASGGDDRTVRFWMPRARRLLRTARPGRDTILALAWSRTGDRLFCAGSGGEVHSIDPETARVKLFWKPSQEWIGELAVDRAGCHIAAGDTAGRVFVKEIVSD